ncbi:MAG: hypothetical protein A2Z86_10835 [Candidatus Glassbacteria bacterium GWA2_58_10]|uniref:Uncharacterized protein n=1 Tax=Candidatus Glassbacteria bacterium GWA2_58_10 TaxID=1817865 RepID=A0A1F5Y9S8_9BACT|nr:MAG: hypothetical protein A2Z86_10835 [Candidatus Glassbacteria bacterium GWA2_58_10]
MVYYYSVVVVLGICMILFLGLLIQRKREETKHRKEMELISAQRRLEDSREKLNNLRKLLYEVENQLSSNKHYFNTKKEELVQMAKELQVVTDERDSIQKTIDAGTTSAKEMNLLNKRLELNHEKLADMSGKAHELQEEVNQLGEKAKQNEEEIGKLQHAIAQAESELEYNRELVKIKERMIKT